MLRDFASRWQGSIEAMHREVLGQVAEPACARDVLQVRGGRGQDTGFRV